MQMSCLKAREYTQGNSKTLKSSRKHQGWRFTESLLSHTLVSGIKKRKQVMLLLFFILSHSLHCIWLFGFAGARIKFMLYEKNHMIFRNTFKMSCQLQINGSYWFHTRDPCSKLNPRSFLILWPIFPIFHLDCCAMSFFIHLRDEVDLWGGIGSGCHDIP